MFGSSWSFKIATVSGIPIKADPGALLLAVLVGGQVQMAMTHGGVPNATLYAVLGGALAIGSILWHEGAHAVVARLQKIHVTAVTLFMFGGATTMETDRREPRKETLVALVGPLSSLVLGLLLIGAHHALEYGPFSVTLLWLGRTNVFLAVFNILPGYPLDGGRVVRSGVTWLTRKPALGDTVARTGGMLVGSAMLAYAGLTFVRTQQAWSAIFLVYVGMMVLTASKVGPTQETLRDELKNMPVTDALVPLPPTIPSSMSLTDALDAYLREYPRSMFPVLGPDGRLVGGLTMERAGVVGRNDPLAPVSSSMVALDDVPTVEATASLLQAIQAMDNGWAIVLRGGMPLGLVTGPSADDAFARIKASM